MGSRNPSRLPTPASTEGSPSSHSTKTSYWTPLGTGPMASPAMGSSYDDSVRRSFTFGSVQGGVGSQRSAFDASSFGEGATIQPPPPHGEGFSSRLGSLDLGESRPLSTFPPQSRSSADFLPEGHFAASAGDTSLIGSALRRHSASVPLSLRGADPRRVPSHYTPVYERDPFHASLNFGPVPLSQEGGLGLAPQGGMNPDDIYNFPNVTVRHPRYGSRQFSTTSSFAPALGDSGGGGLHGQPQSTPTRLCPLPEETDIARSQSLGRSASVRSFRDPVSDHAVPVLEHQADVTRWREDVEYVGMHGGYPATNDIDSYPSDYTNTHGIPFDQTAFIHPPAPTDTEYRESFGWNGYGEPVRLQHQAGAMETIVESSPSVFSYMSGSGIQSAVPTRPGSRFRLRSAASTPTVHPPAPSTPNTPFLQQPQPSRPFSMPVPQNSAPPSVGQHYRPVTATDFHGTVPGPTVARTHSSLSHRRSFIRPPSVLQHGGQQPPPPPPPPSSSSSSSGRSSSHSGRPAFGHEQAPSPHPRGPPPQQPPPHGQGPIGIVPPLPSHVTVAINTKDIPMLTSAENYLPWAEKVKSELQNQRLFCHVTVDQPDPNDFLEHEIPTFMPDPVTQHSPPADIQYASWWFSRDATARAIITSRVSASILGQVPKREEARESREACARTVWNHLARHFGGAGLNVAQAAWDKVKVLKAANGSEVEGILEKWEAAYNKMLLAGEKPHVREVLTGMTMALPESGMWAPLVLDYNRFVEIRIWNDPNTNTTITGIFQGVRNTLNLQADTSNTSTSKVSSKSRSRGSSSTTTSPSSGGAKPVCDNCKSTGHVRKDCWQPGGPLFGDEAGKQRVKDRRRASKESKSPGMAAVNMVSPAAKITEVDNTGGGSSGLAGVCFAGLPQYDSHDAYFPCVTNEDSSLACASLSTRPTWLPEHLDQLLDSGCSRHIFRNKGVFWDYEPIARASMSTANCGALEVQGRGTVRLLVRRSDGRPFLITLKDCRHAPSAALNLISVGTWQKAGISVNFSPRGTVCVIEEKRVTFAAETFDTLSFACGEVIYPGQEGLVMAALAGAKSPSPLIWHYRLAHLGMDDTRKMLTGRWASGVSHSGSWPTSACSACVVGKGARRPIANPRNRATRLLELLHVDICGPFKVSSTSGEYTRRYHYWIAILDDWSNYLHVQPLVDRSGPGIVDVFDEVITRWERRTGQRVSKVRFDGALELTAGELREYLVRGLGVDTQKTAPYNHWQNGKAERIVRTIEDTSTALLAGTHLPRSHWLEATLVAAWTRNRVSTSTLPDGITPYERMHGSKPDISNLRVFGCRGYAWIPTEKRRKGDNRREEVIMVGYERGRVGWWCMTPAGKRMFCADVYWEEDVLGKLSRKGPAASKQPDLVAAEVPARRRSERIAALQEASSSRVNPKSVAGVCMYLHLDPGMMAMVSLEEAERVLGDPDDFLDADLWTGDAHEAGEAVFLATRLDRKRYMRPREFNLDRPPASQWEAYQRSDASKWIAGEKEEVANLWERGVFEKCVLPPGAVAIPTHFVYAEKSDGRVKCRLVADGNRQRKEDVGRTSSPVAMAASVRCVLAEAAAEDLELKSADVKSAFLWAQMSQGTAIYVRQIPKHPDPDGPNIVYQLKRPLYGLQEAAFEFYEYFKGKLASVDMQPCPLDRAVFFGIWKESPDPAAIPMPKDGKPLKLILPVHVDDCLGATNSAPLWDWWIREMNKYMEVKDLGDVEVYLGMRIMRDRSRRHLWISMTDYVDQILSDEGMATCTPATLPLSNNINRLPEPEKAAL